MTYNDDEYSGHLYKSFHLFGNIHFTSLSTSHSSCLHLRSLIFSGLGSNMSTHTINPFCFDHYFIFIFIFIIVLNENIHILNDFLYCMDMNLLFSRDDIYTLQINADSSINPDHLSYFLFVGRIIGKVNFAKCEKVKHTRIYHFLSVFRIRFILI